MTSPLPSTIGRGRGRGGTVTSVTKSAPGTLKQRTIPGIGFSDLLDLPVTVKGPERKKVIPVNSLAELDLEPKLLENVLPIIKSLTPIQRHAIPTLLEGVNVMCASHTGSGKTATFLLPIINMILRKPELLIDSKIGLPATPLVLVLVPTRELAIQVRLEAAAYCRKTFLERSVHLVCGGKDMAMERHRLSKLPCNIVVATCGRLWDIIEQNLLDLGKVKFFVLDEADVMIAKGFAFDVIDLAKKCHEDRLSMMFSATYPNAVIKTAENLLGDSFIEIVVGNDGAASLTITQSFDVVERSQKNYLLRNLIESRQESEKILVFASTVEEVMRIWQFLDDRGISATVIHSELTFQRERETALQQFKDRVVQVLVATSIASRGLDIPNVSLVINYDLPDNIEEYVLRIGRTGRVGNVGESFSFFEIERDGPMADKLMTLLRRADQFIPQWMIDVKNTLLEQQNILEEAYDIGPYSVNKRTYSGCGVSLSGVPPPCEVEDDNWE